MNPTSVIDISTFKPASDRMPALLAHYQADRQGIERRYGVPYSAQRREGLQALLAAYETALATLPWEALSASDKVDWLLGKTLLASEQQQLDQEVKQLAEMETLIPFTEALISLEEARRRHQDVRAADIAAQLDQISAQINATRSSFADQLAADGPTPLPRPAVAYRAASALDQIHKTLEQWFNFYHSYDPTFTWWVEKPYQALIQDLQTCADFLRQQVAGAMDDEAIIGDPIGREALAAELAQAMIPYTPEELTAIAEREKAWCLDELRRAAREMGHGDNWLAALEVVKSRHVAPGQQPALVRDLAYEAIQYVEEHDLVTVPALAREGWRMKMMSPERQKVSPFFLGGEIIRLSFPTNTMSQAQKRMSLRGNNRHFARATVQHELIPGHYLQAFCQERYRPYRRLFYTPFWTEGWTLHWEMLLWERGFAQTPEDRIGLLFWRLHRCARVKFSLGFHLGQMSPAECVTMLVNEVGHEPDNATAEVRRSFGGDYPPLYQCAYLIGGLQVHALYDELVTTGPMSPRTFHDTMLHENCMPIALLRALLTGQSLTPDFQGDWRF